MNADVLASGLGAPLAELRVDGGMVGNDELMQLQADLLNVPVIRPEVTQTTALGAAYAAGLAVGHWESLDELVGNWKPERRWEPALPAAQRERRLRIWKKAVAHSLDWVDEDTTAEELAGD